MVPKIIIFVILAYALVLTCGQDVHEDPEPIPTTKPNSTTTSSTSTTSTTTTPSTTTSKTTTSSTSTTTTTTTTPAPTTTTDAPYPEPTTQPPSTPKPTPTPTPTPPKTPDVGKWNVTDHDTNITCIMVDMAIQLNISYIGSDNKTKHSIVNVPKDAEAVGMCGNVSQILDLEWKESNKTFGNLTVEFVKNDTTKHFMINTIQLTIVPVDTIFPDIKNKTANITLLASGTEFSTPYSKSYQCEKKQSFVLKYVNGANDTDSEIEVSHVHLQAFHTAKDAKFDAAEDCEPSSSPDIVPIAVGCALVALVAIVLIAYLVGRRRSQARGYLSM